MIFISDTVVHEVFVNQITIVKDTVFNKLEGDITLHEGGETIDTITFIAGIILEGRFTTIKLSSGAIIAY